MNLLSRLTTRLSASVVVPAPVPEARKRKPKRDISQEDWLKAEEASALLSAAQGDPRSYAMLAVFLGCGLRCDELRMLDLSDYQLAAGKRGASIHIRYAKGGKERTVPAQAMVVEALDYFLDFRGLAKGKEADCEALFRGRQGRLANRYIRELVKNYGRRAGLGEKVHPHQLRHTFATALCEADVPIEVVRVLCGHVSIATTQLYVAVTDKRRAEAASKINYSSAA